VSSYRIREAQWGREKKIWQKGKLGRLLSAGRLPFGFDSAAEEREEKVWPDEKKPSATKERGLHGPQSRMTEAQSGRWLPAGRLLVEENLNREKLGSS